VHGSTHERREDGDLLLLRSIAMFLSTYRTRASAESGSGHVSLPFLFLGLWDGQGDPMVGRGSLPPLRSGRAGVRSLR
jgi:hypothetical protein